MQEFPILNSEGRSDLVKDEYREVIKGNGKIGRLIEENIRLSEENRSSYSSVIR